ncbi:hypothetical protein CR513_40960, partial [Mucuna pruriens]
MPTIITHPRQSRDHHFNNRLQLLEERSKAIEGADYHDFNVANLCLILNVIILPKFKLLEFGKYKGKSLMGVRTCSNMEGPDRGLLKIIQVQCGQALDCTQL